MNGQFLEFAVSFAAVAALVLVVHLAGFSVPARLASEQEARAIAALTPGGFIPAHVALDASGRGALVADAAQRLVVLRPHGAHFVPELVNTGAVRREDQILLVETGTGHLVALAIAPAAASWAAG